MEPWFSIEEKTAIGAYLETNGWFTEFEKTYELEKIIASFTGARHCILVNNGTISLTLAALAIGIQPGDEVIVPNYTMIATPNSIKMLGAQPVFVDVELDSLCINFELLKNAITPRTKAIFLVLANGRYPLVDIDEFVKLAKENNIVLIEDAAQSLGSYYPNGKHQGTVGKIGSFSFSVPKIISTGQGGALVTNDDEMAIKLRKLKDFGRERGGIDIHDTIGFNFKFTELQALIGIEQMKKLDYRIKRKKQILRRYINNLQGCNEIKIWDSNDNYTTPWFIDSLVQRRESLIKFLFDNGVGTRKMYPPINKQKAYNIKGEHIISEQVGANGLWLPSASQLSDNDIDYISSLILKFYNSTD